MKGCSFYNWKISLETRHFIKSVSPAGSLHVLTTSWKAAVINMRPRCVRPQWCRAGAVGILLRIPPALTPRAGVEYQVQLCIHYHLIIQLIVFQSHFSSSLNMVQIFLFTCDDGFSYLKEFHVILCLHACGSSLSRGCIEALDVCYLGMPWSSAFCLPNVDNFAKRGVNSGLSSPLHILG